MKLMDIKTNYFGIKDENKKLENFSIVNPHLNTKCFSVFPYILVFSIIIYDQSLYKIKQSHI